MKRKNLFCIALSLAAALLLSSCALPASKSAAYVPVQAELARSGGVDWNEVSESIMGTGGRASGHFDNIYFYTPDNDLPFYIENGPETEINGITHYCSNTQVQYFKNTALQDEINNFIISETQRLNGNDDFFAEYVTPDMLDADEVTQTHSTSSDLVFCGNVASVIISDIQYFYSSSEKYPTLGSLYRPTLSYACYDMSSGRRLSLCDLFTDDTDVAALLDPIIAAELSAIDGGPARPFRGLPNDYPYFALYEGYLNIYLPWENPYTTEEYYISIPTETLSPYMAQPFAETSDYLSGGTTFYKGFRQRDTLVNVLDPDADTMYAFGNKGFAFQPVLLRDTTGKLLNIDAINAQIKTIYGQYASMEYPQEYADIEDLGPENYSGYAYSYIAPYRNFVAFNMGASIYAYTPYRSETISTGRVFDLRTGRAVSLGELCTDPDAARQYIDSCGLYIEDPYSFYDIYTYSPDAIYIKTSGDEISLPAEYIDTSFFE